MDAIDRIAGRFMLYCLASVQGYSEIVFIMDSCGTAERGMGLLAKLGYLDWINPEKPESARAILRHFEQCVESMDAIKKLARKVFIYNFFERDSLSVFQKEASFSYACKILGRPGPRLCHFTGHPLQSDIVTVELYLACRTPRLDLDDDLYCLEVVGPEETPEETPPGSPLLLCTEDF